MLKRGLVIFSSWRTLNIYHIMTYTPSISVPTAGASTALHPCGHTRATSASGATVLLQVYHLVPCQAHNMNRICKLFSMRPLLFAAVLMHTRKVLPARTSQNLLALKKSAIQGRSGEETVKLCVALFTSIRKLRRI